MTTLFVGNLSPEVDDADLRQVFSTYGEIGSIRVPRDRRGRLRGFAYVELEAQAATAAVEALKGTQLRGRTMDVVVDRPSSGARRVSRRSYGGGSRRRR